MNLRLSWKDPRLSFPTSWQNNTSRDAQKEQDGGSEEESLALSTDILKKLWVPDLFIRRTRAMKSFTLLQKAQGLILFSNKTVFTSSM